MNTLLNAISEIISSEKEVKALFIGEVNTVITTERFRRLEEREKELPNVKMKNEELKIEIRNRKEIEDSLQKEIKRLNCEVEELKKQLENQHNPRKWRYTISKYSEEDGKCYFREVDLDLVDICYASKNIILTSDIVYLRSAFNPLLEKLKEVITHTSKQNFDTAISEIIKVVEKILNPKNIKI